LQGDSTDYVVFSGTRLVLQEKIGLEEREIGGNSEVNLIEMNKNNDLKDRVGIQMDQLNFEVI
jgi:hypothetical protein